MSLRCRWRRDRRGPWATSSATSTTPSTCRWKPVSTPRRSIIRAPAKPPTTRKPRRRSSKNVNPSFRVIEMTEVVEMAGYIRRRQICLVAPQLEPVISDIAGIMGLRVCYRDGNVAKYGLENALLPVDTILLEVVAPFQQGPAPRRLMDKTGGRGGYMALFCCDDPDGGGTHDGKIGVW